MACLNGGRGDTYTNFDVENHLQPSVVPGPSYQLPKPRSNRRCNCSLPLMLAIATLMLSIAALGVAIDARVALKRVRKRPRGVLLTSHPASVPNGYKAINMFMGTGYFARLQPMLYPRSDHKTFPIGSTVYIIGGLTNAEDLPGGNMSGPPEPLVLRANVAYNTYTQLSTPRRNMPEPRFRFCGAVLDGQIYVVAGMNKYEAPDATHHGVLGSVLRYDPTTDTWTRLKGTLAHPRSDCCAAAVAGRLVVAGGWTTDYTDTLGSVEVYDPATDTWTFASNLTTPRGDCEAVGLQDRYMLVMGGVTAAGPFTSSVEALDVSQLPGGSPTWTPRANMTLPRGDFAAEALAGGRVIVMGGETSNGTATEFAMHQVEEYIIADDVWVPKAPLPEARFRFDTAHVSNPSGDRVYVLGGEPTCVSGETGDGSKQPCLDVGLNSTWAFYDVKYPDIFAVVKQDSR